MCTKFRYLRKFSHNTRSNMELIPFIQTYDWGKCGNRSKVAVLYKNVKPDFEIEPNKPYAELWMGTHANGQSYVKGSEKSLLAVISEQPNYLGDSIRTKFGEDLPYLLKILSIQKALSIQVHPSKTHAEMLHAKDPQIYKDPNHKPELAIALTPFEALCGFRPVSEIVDFFKSIPELQEIIGDSLCNTLLADSSEVNLKKCFRALMMSSEDKIKNSLKQILKRFSELDTENRNKMLADLVERLYKQFPDDVGCFVVYFLNYLQLKPLEAVYLGANLPHAYLSGDCVECMACSDNVVRAGLTPKLKDVETLCAMLDYRGEPAHAKLYKPNKENDYTVIFKPPVPDFAVAKIEVPDGIEKLTLVCRNSASILLTISGTAFSENVSLFAGVSVFIPAKEEVILKNVSPDFLAFQAMANV